MLIIQLPASLSAEEFCERFDNDFPDSFYVRETHQYWTTKMPTAVAVIMSCCELGVGALQHVADDCVLPRDRFGKLEPV